MSLTGIQPGATIDSSNWQQYKQFLPYGRQTMFSGSGFWKAPADFQMKVGPAKVLPLPRGYVQASEQYGSQTSMETIGLPQAVMGQLATA